MVTVCGGDDLFGAGKFWSFMVGHPIYPKGIGKRVDMGLNCEVLRHVVRQRRPRVVFSRVGVMAVSDHPETIVPTQFLQSSVTVALVHFRVNTSEPAAVSWQSSSGTPYSSSRAGGK